MGRYGQEAEQLVRRRKRSAAAARSRASVTDSRREIPILMLCGRAWTAGARSACLHEGSGGQAASRTPRAGSGTSWWREWSSRWCGGGRAAVVWTVSRGAIVGEPAERRPEPRRHRQRCRAGPGGGRRRDTRQGPDHGYRYWRSRHRRFAAAPQAGDSDGRKKAPPCRRRRNGAYRGQSVRGSCSTGC